MKVYSIIILCVGFLFTWGFVKTLYEMHCIKLMVKKEGTIVAYSTHEIDNSTPGTGEPDTYEHVPLYICEVNIDNQITQYRVNYQFHEVYQSKEDALDRLKKDGYPIGKKISLYVNPEKSKHHILGGTMPNAKLEEKMHPHKYYVKRGIVTFFLGPFLIVVGLGGGFLFGIYTEKRKKKKIEQRKKRVEQIIKGKSNGKTF